MSTWQLSEAKNRLSRLVAETKHGAQVITVRGVETAVVMSMEDYRRLSRPSKSLVAFLRESPLAELGDELDIERETDTGREVDL